MLSVRTVLTSRPRERPCRQYDAPHSFHSLAGTHRFGVSSLSSSLSSLLSLVAVVLLVMGACGALVVVRCDRPCEVVGHRRAVFLRRYWCGPRAATALLSHVSAVRRHPAASHVGDAGRQLPQLYLCRLLTPLPAWFCCISFLNFSDGRGQRGHVWRLRGRRWGGRGSRDGASDPQARYPDADYRYGAR